MPKFVSAMFPLVITEGAAGFDQIEKNDLVALVNQHLEMVLYTRQGEIISDIAFGVGIQDYLFSNPAEPKTLAIGNTIKQQIQQYIGYLTYFVVTVDTSKIDYNTLGVQIKYAIDNLDVNEVANFVILP
jgi:predicted component of type VI protein secretion system